MKKIFMILLGKIDFFGTLLLTFDSAPWNSITTSITKYLQYIRLCWGLCWGWLDYESNQELWWHKWHFLASRLTYLALKLHIHTLRLPKIRLKSNAFTRVGFLLSSFCNNQFAPRDPGFIVQILAGKNIFSTFCLFLNILFMRLFKDSSLGYSIIAN